MKIIPALLVKTADEYISQLKALSFYFSRFHIDIADGQFVPSTTIQIDQLASVQNTHQQVLKKKTFDLHLMVDNYQPELEKLIRLSQIITIKTVFIHFDVFKKSYINPQKIPFDLGIVLNPENSIENCWDSIRPFSAIQIMSVNPGFQGSPFLPHTLMKIAQLRERKYTGPIFLDGGINDTTMPTILKNKSLPDMLCIGSYLRENIAEKKATIQALISPTTTLKEKDVAEEM